MLAVGQVGVQVGAEARQEVDQPLADADYFVPNRVPYDCDVGNEG